MSYFSAMSFVNGFTSEEAADIYLEKLLFGLEDLGYEDIQIDQFDIDNFVDPYGACLIISGATIAIGIGENEFEAAGNLLERAADLFFHDTPEV
tara:strand:- start:174 stop:455 length:282 start_codon:yes stop_codon:yes gene_type:complete